MRFRTSLTTLAAVAALAFVVSVAQAGSCGSPCPGKMEAGGPCKMQKMDAGYSHGAMKAEGCMSACKQHGMTGGDCKGKMGMDCCKAGQMGMRGMPGEMGCKWSCNGIWGDYDCSNPGGKALLDMSRSRNMCRVTIRCEEGEDPCMMMRGGMGGEGGRMMMRGGMGGEGGMMMHKEGCCSGGMKMERKVMIMHNHEGPCTPGCKGMGMEHGAPGAPTPPPQPETAPPAGK